MSSPPTSILDRIFCLASSTLLGSMGVSIGGSAGLADSSTPLASVLNIGST